MSLIASGQWIYNYMLAGWIEFLSCQLEWLKLIDQFFFTHIINIFVYISEINNTFQYQYWFSGVCS